MSGKKEERRGGTIVTVWSRQGIRRLLVFVVVCCSYWWICGEVEANAIDDDPQVINPFYCTPDQEIWDHITDVYDRPFAPMDCATLQYNPPVFTFPLGAGIPGSIIWEVRIISMDTQIEEREETSHTWLPWPRLLLAGDYQWSYRVKNSDIWKSPELRFRILPTASEWLIPTTAAAWARAASLPRPRSLPPAGPERDSWVNDWLTGARKQGWIWLVQRVTSKISDVMPDIPLTYVAGAGNPTLALANLAFGTACQKLAEAAREAALVSVILGTPAIIADARRRSLFLVRLDPNGASSFAADNLSGRRFAMVIVLLYDYLYDYLSESERGEFVLCIQQRIPPIHVSVVGDPNNPSVEWEPVSEYSHETLLSMVTLSSMLAGSIPEARDWFEGSYINLLSFLSPFGGDDGGYAQGTNYGMWFIEFAEEFDVIRFTTGVDVTKKSWVRNYGRQLVYFSPPLNGIANGEFGDGSEVNDGEPNDRLMFGYSARTKDPLYQWYSSQISGQGDVSRLMMLLTPPMTIDKSMPLPPHTPNSICLYSIGWAAMHSSLADINRTSVYFKSSKFGAFGHSHGDQNTFTLMAHTRQLAIETGWYDYYGSAFELGWYKTTKAHNGITYDGGTGQQSNLLISAHGHLTNFSSVPDYDLVTGDATTAYGGDILKAIRTIIFIRPSTTIIFDTLVANTAKRWEWNLHTPVTPTSADHSVMNMTNIDTSLFVRVAGSALDSPPMTLSNLTLNQYFPYAPGATPLTQWHGRWSAGDATNKFTFAALLQVNINSTTEINTGTIPTRTGVGAWEVRTNRFIINYQDGDVVIATR